MVFGRMLSPAPILVSGASGFIWQRLRQALSADRMASRLLNRKGSPSENLVIGDLANRPTLAKACAGTQLVLHCASYSHAFGALSDVDASWHGTVNFEGSSNHVEAAVQGGVKRFVLLSSVKAMAEPGDACADETLPGKPRTAHGQAKRADEEAVLEVGTRYGMHLVDLRLRMACRAGGRGNLERIGSLVRRELCLPLPETGNRRSLVHVNDSAP